MLHTNFIILSFLLVSCSISGMLQKYQPDQYSEIRYIEGRGMVLVITTREESKREYIRKFIETLTTEEDFKYHLYGSALPALLEVAQLGNTEFVEKILAKKPPLAVITNQLGDNIFHILAKTGNTRLMKLVIQHCLDEKMNVTELINKENNIFNATPLHVAAEHGRTKYLQLLLKYGAKINPQNKYLETPLHLAANSDERGQRKRNHTVKILCIAGANLNAEDEDCDVPQEFAKLANYSETESFLKYFRYHQLKLFAKNNYKPNYLSFLPQDIFLLLYQFLLTTEFALPKIAESKESKS